MQISRLYGFKDATGRVPQSVSIGTTINSYAKSRVSVVHQRWDMIVRASSDCTMSYAESQSHCK
ncbi:MAG: hypothetical protein NVSMB42_10910 [Herpetosiphon sp.]